MRAPPPWPHLNLTSSQRCYLQIPSHWMVKFQHPYGSSSIHGNPGPWISTCAIWSPRVPTGETLGWGETRGGLYFPPLSILTWTLVQCHKISLEERVLQVEDGSKNVWLIAVLLLSSLIAELGCSSSWQPTSVSVVYHPWSSSWLRRSSLCKRVSVSGRGLSRVRVTWSDQWEGNHEHKGPVTKAKGVSRLGHSLRCKWCGECKQ